ncbi:MAG: hypothetical protein HXY30_01350 [Pseudorhodoplanes sp.]|nr:hypothetical protein [Pseudorhodoplanes sp.]
MCDYSLQHVASTPAKVGDKLVTTRFENSITRGFSAVGRPDVAVCLLPGTELAFDRNVECDRALGILPRRSFNAKLARFRQLNTEQPHAHHDALEFPDGQTVFVTQLSEGQTATVLQLPASPKPAETPAIEDTVMPAGMRLVI